MCTAHGHEQSAFMTIVMGGSIDQTHESPTRRYNRHMWLLLSFDFSVLFHIPHYNVPQNVKKNHGILQVLSALILLGKKGAYEFGHARVNE